VSTGGAVVVIVEVELVVDSLFAILKKCSIEERWYELFNQSTENLKKLAVFSVEIK
jgi:hypothetical protein